MGCRYVNILPSAWQAWSFAAPADVLNKSPARTASQRMPGGHPHDMHHVLSLIEATSMQLSVKSGQAGRQSYVNEW